MATVLNRSGVNPGNPLINLWDGTDDELESKSWYESFRVANDVATALTILGIGGYAVPGATTQLIFNDAGVLAGSASLSYNKVSHVLTAGGFVTAGAVSCTAFTLGGVNIFTGAGSPEAVIVAGVGSYYFRSDGNETVAIYKKVTGTGNTGWIVIAGGGSAVDLASPGPIGGTAPGTIAGTTGNFSGILTTGSGLRRHVRVVTAAGAIAITSADDIVCINKTVGAASAVALPAGAVGMIFTIVDGKGDAAANNITVTPAAGTINGAATDVIVNNYTSRGYMYNGTEWNKI